MLCNRTSSTTAAGTKPAKTPQPDRDLTNQDQPPPYQRTTTTRKKKQVREPDLGVGAQLGVRVGVGDRGQDEETQGESQTPKGVWVSPAPEKERKKRTTPTTIPNTKEREREREGTTNIWAYRGQVLKGTKPNNIPTPETKRTKQNTQHPSQGNLTKTKHMTSKVSEDLSPQGGGAHGPPCLLLESHPRGPWYRGVRRPPHHGNRPRWRNNHTSCQTNY